MSAVTIDRPVAAPATRPSLTRLTAVELRKMVDTRAGFWLQLAVLALSAVFAVIRVATGHAPDHTLHSVLESAVAPAVILLPIVGILLVSSEWSQRTSLITFALVPQRSRVLGAKLAASVVLSLAALAACVGIAAVATAIASPGVAGTWSLSLGLLVQVTIYLVTAMIGGVAFGALFLSSAPAIVVSFALPLALAAIGSLSFMSGAGKWIDGSQSLDPLTHHLMSPTEWARAGVTLLLWTALPLLAGGWRILRSEVR